MKRDTNQRAAIILQLSFSYVLLCFAVIGCNKDSGPTGPIDSPPNVAGRWVGSGTYNDPPYYNEMSVTGGVTQTANILGGSLVWIITTPGNPAAGYTTTVDVEGTVMMSRDISLHEIRAVNPHNDWDCTYLIGTLSANGDTISCTRKVSPGSTQSIGTLKLVRQK